MQLWPCQIFFFHECGRHAQVIVEGKETLHIDGKRNAKHENNNQPKTQNPKNPNHQSNARPEQADPINVRCFLCTDVKQVRR